MGADILDLIRQAAEEGHNRSRLQAELARRMASLRDRLPRMPNLSPYLQQRLAHPEHMDGHDASSVLTAVAQVVRPDDEASKADLVVLNLLAARLGAAAAILTVGAQVTAALQAIPVSPTARDPWDDWVSDPA